MNNKNNLDKIKSCNLYSNNMEESICEENFMDCMEMEYNNNCDIKLDDYGNILITDSSSENGENEIPFTSERKEDCIHQYNNTLTIDSDICDECCETKSFCECHDIFTSDEKPTTKKIPIKNNSMNFSTFIDGGKRFRNESTKTQIIKINQKPNIKMNVNNIQESTIDNINQTICCSPPERDILANKLKGIYPKTATKWVDSNIISTCQKCDQQFTALTGKHHCRACGRVFCYDCCNKNEKNLEEFIQKPLEDDDIRQSLSNAFNSIFTGQLNRKIVCNDCHKKINDIKNVKYLINIFEYCDLQTMHNLFAASSDLAISVEREFKNVDEIKKFLNLSSSITQVEKDCEFVENTKITKKNKSKYIKIEGIKIGNLEYPNQFTKLVDKTKIFISKENWDIAGIYQLSKFRMIQYKSPSILYNNWEINILWSSRYYFADHGSWLINLIKSSIQKYYSLSEFDNTKQQILSGLMFVLSKKEKNSNCWNMMCSRKCSIPLDMLDFLEILKFVAVLEKDTKKKIFWSNDNLQRFMVFMLNKLYKQNEMDEDMIKTLIPLICSVFSEIMNMEKKKICYEYLEKMFDEIFETKILIHFVMEIYYMENCTHKSFGAINFADFMTKYIESKLKINLKNELSNMVKVFDILNQEKEKNINRRLPILYPFDLNYNITKIIETKRLKSNTAPLLITLEISNTNCTKIVKMIVKKDSKLRKERIVSCLISLLQHKLKERSLKGKLNNFEKIPTYEIVMLTSDFGAIEFVENSVTLRMINQDYHMSLQTYIMTKNKSTVVETITNRFIESLAISSCLSYILGLGDRHMDNIMINNLGQIFHIDYGYIMENPITSILGSPNIKMTSDMVEFIGGLNENNQSYVKFKDYVLNVYDILRLHKNIIVNYYEMLGNEGFIDWRTFKRKLENRFMDGMKCEDIEVTLVNEIKTSNSFANTFSDICHNTKQKWQSIGFGLF